MHFTAVSGLEGNWTVGALVKDFTVFLLNVSLLALKGLENHITVETSERKGHLIPFLCLQCTIACSCQGLQFMLAYLLVPGLTSVMQAIFLDMLLYICRAAQGATLRTAVRGLVCMNAFMSFEAALIWQQH